MNKTSRFEGMLVNQSFWRIARKTDIWKSNMKNALYSIIYVQTYHQNNVI